MHDGRQVRVDRSFWAQEYGLAVRNERTRQSLSFKSPLTGQTVRWKGGLGYDPVILEATAEKLFLVVLMSGCDADLSTYGKLKIPYVPLTYERGNWIPIDPKEYPKELRGMNLTPSHSDMRVQGAVHSAETIKVLTITSSEPRISSGYLQNPIPSDLGDWHYQHKEQPLGCIGQPGSVP